VVSVALENFSKIIFADEMVSLVQPSVEKCLVGYVNIFLDL
jgi:hypothetical protein